MTPVNSGWRTGKLDELPVAFVDGDRSARYPKRSEFVEQGVPFLNAESISSGRLESSKANFVSRQKFDSITKGRLEPGDLILTTRGNGVGKPAFFDGPSRPALINAQLLILRPDHKTIFPKYFYYSFCDPDFQSQIRNFVSGSAQPQLPIHSLRNLLYRHPPLPTQRKIASILSAYDDLIENNTRRIAILGELAQAIYREWFVNFRFPGHENVKLVDSPLGQVPDGWEATKLGNHLLQIESGKRPRGGVSEHTAGVPSVGAENIRGIGKHNYAAEKYVPVEFFKTMRKGVVRHKDVGLYKDGAYIGRSSYFRDRFPHDDFCVNEHVFLLRPNGKSLTSNFLYTWLQAESTVKQIRGTNANAAQPGINQKTTKGLTILLPDHSLMQRFDLLIESFYAELIVLAKQNRVLRSTRDLLLPKLISGKLDVEDLDIDLGLTTEALEEVIA